MTASARPRPYFLPETIDFEALPDAVKTAIDTIIQPAYEELVLAAVGALERSAGATIVFLLTEELFDQFELRRILINDGTSPKLDGAEREKLLRSHLKLVNAKQSATQGLLKIRRLAAEHAAVAEQIPSMEPAS